MVDDGPGMSPADRTRAFDRFWRHEGASRGGTGLGLSIVSQLARISGGAAWLDASPGGGVDAVVRLEADDRSGAMKQVRPANLELRVA